MDTNQKGDIAEANVVAQLIEKGYTVSEPVNDHCRYDLVVDNGELNRVQVKYASLREEGRIYVSIKSSNPNTSGSNQKYYNEDEVDAFAVYCSDTDAVYWVEYDDAPKSGMYLRTDNYDGNHHKINWASDYEI